MQRQQRSRTHIVLLLIILLCVGVATGYYGVRYLTGQLTPAPLPQAHIQTTPSPTPGIRTYTLPTPELTAEPAVTNAGYLLKTYQSGLAAFEVLSDGTASLLNIYEIDPRLLPEIDRKRLEEGIMLTSLEELLILLEDYQ